MYNPNWLIWRDHAHYSPNARNTLVIFKAGLVAEGENEYANLVIGGPDKVRDLIHDLRSLLARMDPPSQDGIWKEVASDEQVDMLERDLCQCVTCIDKAQLINRIRFDAVRLAEATRIMAAADAALTQALASDPAPREPDKFCAWPLCDKEPFCTSGNYGGLAVCRQHFMITNGIDSSTDGNLGRVS